MLRAMDRGAARTERTPDAEVVAAAASALIATLALARSLVGGGRRVDLSGLEREAAALCAAALVLPREQARSLLPSLAAIEREIAALMEALPRPA
jgi:hypothetical protein